MKSNTDIASGLLRIARETPGRTPLLEAALCVLLLAVLGAGCTTTAPHPQASTLRTDPLMLDISSYLEPFNQSGQPVTYYGSVMGVQEFDGLPFRIAGQAILFGRAFVESRGATYRKSIEGIPVGRRFDQLNLIHY